VLVAEQRLDLLCIHQLHQDAAHHLLVEQSLVICERSEVLDVLSQQVVQLTRGCEAATG
jgi:hypothetical protein